MSSDRIRPREGESNNSEAQLFAHMRSDWPKVPSSSAPLSSATLGLGALMAAHDKPHKHSAIEWWYVNGHVDVKKSSAANPGFGEVTPMSFFAAFFRLHIGDGAELKSAADVSEVDRSRILGMPRLYSLNWAVTDHSEKSYRPFSFVDHRTPKALLTVMQAGLWQGNQHLNAALQEVFAHDSVPAPDMLFTKPTHCNEEELDISLQGCTLKAVRNRSSSAASGCPHSYVMHLEGTDEKGTISIDVTIDPTKAAVLHGRDGIVSVTADRPGPEDMFYYFLPRCDFHGTVTRSTPNGDSIRDERIAGISWLDHEFGGCIPSSREELEVAVVRPAVERNGAEYTWEWAALQLSNDTEVSAVRLKCGGGTTMKLIDTFIVAREGKNPSYRIDTNQMEFFADRSDSSSSSSLNGNKAAASCGKFSSPRTSQDFMTKWRIRFKSPLTGAAVDLLLDTETLDQEFVALTAKPSFWEGHVRCKGTWAGAAVGGDGYLECRGDVSGTLESFYDTMHTMMCFPLKTVAHSLSGSAPGDFREYIEKEMDAALVDSPLAGVLDNASKQFLVHIGCAYVFTVKAGKNVRGRMLDWIEDRYREHPHARAPNFHLLLLRAFSLREMDVASGLIREPAVCTDIEAQKKSDHGAAAAGAASSSAVTNSNSSNDGCAPAPCAVADMQGACKRVGEKVGFNVEPFHVATDSDLARQPTAAEMDALERHFSGKWEMIQDRSEPTSTLLAAQQVNLFIRVLTDRLVPSLDTTVLRMPPTVITEVTTSMSKGESKTEIGREAKAFSKGRGELTSRSCIQDGGRTLYTKTFVPAGQTVKVEHKWTRVEQSTEGEHGAVRRCVEFYRYDPTGSESPQSLYAGRLFLYKKH